MADNQIISKPEGGDDEEYGPSFWRKFYIVELLTLSVIVFLLFIFTKAFE